MMLIVDDTILRVVTLTVVIIGLPLAISVGLLAHARDSLLLRVSTYAVVIVVGVATLGFVLSLSKYGWVVILLILAGALGEYSRR